MNRLIVLLIVVGLLGCTGQVKPIRGNLSVRIIVFGLYHPTKVGRGIAPSVGEINAKTIHLKLEDVRVEPNETVIVNGSLISKPYYINGREYYYCGNVTIEVYEAKMVVGGWSRVSGGIVKRLCSSKIFLPPNTTVPFELVITGLKRGKVTLLIVAKGEWWKGWAFLNVTVE